jgi:hypothetical protein
LRLIGDQQSTANEQSGHQQSAISINDPPSINNLQSINNQQSQSTLFTPSIRIPQSPLRNPL